MLSGYVQMGYGRDAFEFFKAMMCSDVRPQSATFVGIIPVFSDIGCFEMAKQIHGLAIVNGCNCDNGETDSWIFGTVLIDMYANCGDWAMGELFNEAVELFRRMVLGGIKPNETTFDCIMPLYLQGGKGVLELIHLLERMDLKLSGVSNTLLNQIYEHIDDVKQVKELHQYLCRDGCISDNSVAASLIQLYSKFAVIEAAEEIFSSITVKELDCWNALIACYAYNKYTSKALNLFNSMRKAGIQPNLLSWNIVIAGFVNGGDYDSALQLFTDMIWTNQNPDLRSFDIILPLIRSNTCSMIGKELHCMYLRNEFEMCKFVSTAFINMYGNCGDVAYAVNIFESMESKDLVSWNAIISGYAHNGLVDECLKHFHELQLEGLKPNSITIASILPACAQSATLSHGRSIHGYIIRSVLDDEDLIVSNALMDMFVKCGCLQYAERVFRRLSQRDVVSWNTMIHGFAIYGNAEAALALFDQMVAEGAVPNSITFIGVLNACSHAGLVNEGWKQFNSMGSKYGITPSGKHYACMVDILGRRGHFKDVRDFIVQMPLQPTASLWGALLSACKTHGNAEMAEYAANNLIELQPENPGNYVVLSNIYAKAGRWNDVDRVRKMMFDCGLKKSPGGSWVEIGNKVHGFAVENNLAKQDMEEIYKTVLDLVAVMIEEDIGGGVEDEAAEKLGFEKVSEQVINECKSKAVLFRHKKTGCEVMSVSNDDENKVFGIVFRTPLTCYPVASTNTKHVYNLVDVYLDAVFFPKCVEDKRVGITSLTILQKIYLLKALFPDNTYGVDSGGDPNVIPKLTFEEFQDCFFLRNLLWLLQWQLQVSSLAGHFQFWLFFRLHSIVRREVSTKCSCLAFGAAPSSHYGGGGAVKISECEQYELKGPEEENTETNSVMEELIHTQELNEQQINHLTKDQTGTLKLTDAMRRLMTSIFQISNISESKYTNIDVSNEDLLSLGRIRHLLDEFICCQEEFRGILFNNKGHLCRQPMDRFIAEYFERSAKALDRTLGEGQFRRAKKALTDLTIAMLDEKDSRGVLALTLLTSILLEQFKVWEYCNKCRTPSIPRLNIHISLASLKLGRLMNEIHFTVDPHIISRKQLTGIRQFGCYRRAKER
ncbi:hypothetical protein IFM89_023619 [Coptis chinensis]|uniref:Pentatricopeptide repeat-containing protein n=1 Tax=Coptis chinensis TaxID=261450 RepID=A0A835LSJ9_9MAGN|nr:hypothetical protein IFM89_023619 [Coptis chinensis]